MAAVTVVDGGGTGAAAAGADAAAVCMYKYTGSMTFGFPELTKSTKSEHIVLLLFF